jgi:hypothetical protein
VAGHLWQFIHLESVLCGIAPTPPIFLFAGVVQGAFVAGSDPELDANRIGAIPFRTGEGQGRSLPATSRGTETERNACLRIRTRLGPSGYLQQRPLQFVLRAREHADHRGVEERHTGQCKTSGSPRSAGTDAREATFRMRPANLVVARHSLRAKDPLLNVVPSTFPLHSHRLDLLRTVAGAEHTDPEARLWIGPGAKHG